MAEVRDAHPLLGRAMQLHEQGLFAKEEGRHPGIPIVANIGDKFPSDVLMYDADVKAHTIASILAASRPHEGAPVLIGMGSYT
mmetsp:Transcript_16442/g.39124  ORF Transcript_16442/g.39124 Transcript_16442/m.39124 type:complete len:83 (-) Transcript_16442:522-770(-)